MLEVEELLCSEEEVSCYYAQIMLISYYWVNTLICETTLCEGLVLRLLSYSGWI